uniref:TMEM14 family protein n=1 Tax=Salmonella sp. s55004 TaxID=3159675 RepID=UPI00397EEA6C
KMTDIVAYGYAAIVVVGGLIGYLKAGSVMSLAAGLLFGGGAAYGAMLTSRNPANVLFLLGVSTTLFCVMGYRYSNSGKFMPGGLVASLSLLMICRYGYRLYSS